MRKIILLGTLALTYALLIMGSGCSPDIRMSDSPISNSVITVTYNAVFNGETASGNLYLVVDMSIDNKGYQSFNTSPSNFSVEVGEYSYDASESELPTVELPDGGHIMGKLTFQVPPQAATSRTGYRMAYSGQTHQNVEWVKSTDSPSDDSVPPVADPVVNIAYSTDLMWVSSPGIQYLKVEPPGNLYLVVEMTIKNIGYESFDTSPGKFSVEVSSLPYSITALVEEELIDWRVIDIPNNGEFTGTLAFLVPTEIAQSFYRWEYQMRYSGARAYNVEWTKVKVSQCIYDADESDLEAIDLPDGGNISGKIAFLIPPELAVNNARHEMLYDEETFHNVQWFNKPDSVVDVNNDPISYPVIKITYSTDLLRREDNGRIYLVADVYIENIGYESFYTSPANFWLEINT